MWDAFLFHFSELCSYKVCVSIADCSETSVLRLRSLRPYVPLRQTPSENASAIDTQVVEEHIF